MEDGDISVYGFTSVMIMLLKIGTCTDKETARREQRMNVL